MTVNFWSITSAEDFESFVNKDGRPIFTAEHLEHMNESSKMKSFNQTVFEKKTPVTFVTNPSVTKKNIFTGKINKKSLRMLAVRSSVYIVFFQTDEKTKEKELKIFLISPQSQVIKQIKCQILMVLENSNKGSSKTQYEFSVFKSHKFPRGRNAENE